MTGRAGAEERASESAIRSELHSLAVLLRHECKRDPFASAPEVLQVVAARLDIMAQHLPNLWSTLEADHLRITRIRHALAVRTVHAVLLHAIAIEPGKFHARDALRQAIGSSSLNVVHVHISYLRAALHNQGFGTPIQTERCKGYWISPGDAALLAKLWQQ